MDAELIQVGDTYASRFGRRKLVKVEEPCGDTVKVIDATGKRSTMLTKSLIGNYTLHVVNGGNGSVPAPANAERIDYTTEFVAPGDANTWLIQRHPLNRAISQSVVVRYARDMGAGRWRLTHQGIAFDKDGRLFDGQHRLSAIVRANAGAWLTVARYSACDADEAKLACDIGRTRNIGCVGEVSGMFEKGKGRAIAAIVGGMMILEKNPKQNSPQEVIEFYGANQAAIDWVIGALKGKEFNYAICAAFALAYTAEPVAVAALADMVVSKIGYADGSPAHAYVRHASEGHFQYNQRTGRPVIMAKVLRVIKAHCAGEKGPQKLYETNDAADWFLNRRVKKARAA